MTRMVAARLARMAEPVDVVHTWPRAARRTLLAARRLGIPTSWSARTPTPATSTPRWARSATGSASTCRRAPRADGTTRSCGARRRSTTWPTTSSARPTSWCGPSLIRGGPREAGAPPVRLRPGALVAGARGPTEGDQPFTLLFAGYGAVRKGLHFALAAWRDSPVSRRAASWWPESSIRAIARSWSPCWPNPVSRCSASDTTCPSSCAAATCCRAAQPGGGLTPGVHGGHGQRHRAGRVRGGGRRVPPPAQRPHPPDRRRGHAGAIT